MELILGVLHLVLFIWALLSILGSRASGLAKLIRTALKSVGSLRRSRSNMNPFIALPLR